MTFRLRELFDVMHLPRGQRQTLLCRAGIVVFLLITTVALAARPAFPSAEVVDRNVVTAGTQFAPSAGTPQTASFGR